MKRKLAIVVLLVCALSLGGATLSAYAFRGGKMKGHDMSLEDKFSCKTRLIMVNEAELGLSDKQAKKVRELDRKTQRDLIMKNAEIDVLAMDINAHMQGDAIDVTAVNKLIDKKYDLKKEKAKMLVAHTRRLRTF